MNSIETFAEANVRKLVICAAMMCVWVAPAAPVVRGQNSTTGAAPASDSAAAKHAKRAAKTSAATADAAAPAASAVPDKPDYDAIYKLKDEGFSRSKVMEIESYLTDVYGPRLTNSPNVKAAAEWTTKQMNDWGLANVKTEAWEPFGRGWSNEHFFAQMTTPRPFILIGYPKAWTPGTNGLVTGEVVYAPIANEADMAKFKGQLSGKMVMTQVPDPVLPHFEADAKRYTDAELADLASFQIPGGVDKAREDRIAQFRATRELQAKIMKFFLDEGVVAWLEDQRGDDGTVFAQQGGSRDPKDPPACTRVALAAEHYGRLYRLLEKKIPVTVTMDIENKFYDNDLSSFNITGEIPGTDKADEVVMLGGHFDSWQAGTGATDNGAGSAVMLEAIRILKASGLKMRRTVRVGLWTGEEEGLLGSRAYVKAHFGDPETMKLTPEQAKLDAYYNIDNGTGKIRGVYLQGNEAVAPIFTAWMEPFHNLGMTTLSIRNTGGTDHLSFNAVGLPGFQFIQDPMDYDSRTHHSNMDLYERVQEADMKQMAVIVASFVYMTANRPDMIPRKPLPPPTPQQRF
ncbi:MAG TPA: M20/M25/M40 family metallo-hydrolase [Candidatus Acidoferrales bacterium]